MKLKLEKYKMFYIGDIIRFQELPPKPKLNWLKKIFYKKEKPPYIVSYKKLDPLEPPTAEYRILLKNGDIFEVTYSGFGTLLLKKLNVNSNSNFCEFDPHLKYTERINRFENFTIISKEEIKRKERKKKLENIANLK